MKSLKTRERTTGNTRQRALQRALARTTVLTGARIARHVLMAAAVGATAMADPATADEWTGAVSGDWFNGGNWADGTFPTSADDTDIDVNAPFSPVIDTSGAETRILFVGRSEEGSLLIEGGGELSSLSSFLGRDEGSLGEVTVTDTLSSWTTSGFLVVGDEGTGMLNILNEGEVISLQQVRIGEDETSTGTATVDGSGSQWTASDQFAVGFWGEGSLAITNGGVVSGSTYTSIGSWDSGVGTVEVSGGSLWDISGNLVVGRRGKGTLTVEDGGTVNNAGLASISDLAGSTGTATVTGAGSTWTTLGTLWVGNEGAGELTIADGGLVESVGGLIGDEEGSVGIATVSGGTWNLTDPLVIGEIGDGTLIVENGGLVSNTRWATLGLEAGATGTATVTGHGSIWQNTGAIEVGNSGDGALTIADGGAVSNTNGFIGYMSSGTGTVTVVGTDSKWTNSGDIYVGDEGDGTLTVQDGAAVTSQNSVIGFHADSTGMVRVAGLGSTWTSTGPEFYIGAFGTGTLAVEDGGTVSSGGGSVIGFAPGPGGTVIVTGDGSSWASAGPLFVGGEGEGTLTIDDGGVVSNAAFGSIGEQPGSTGAVTVTGPGSTWTNAGDLYIGRQGEGTLTITDGGMVSSDFGLIASNNLSATGTVTVSGAGSAWTNSGDLIVGWVGEGALTIEDGGHVSNTDGSVGVSGIMGTVLVTGVDSTWTNSGQLLVGGLGVGTLAITDGATVSSNTALVGGSAGGQGSVTVTGAGSTWMDSGDLRIGYRGEGTLTVENGGAVSSAGGALGDFAGSNGTAVVTGEGSSWANAGVLTIGGSGEGTLTIADGGEVSNDFAYVGFLDSGNVTVAGSGSIWTNSSSFTLGYQAQGTLSISDDAVVSAQFPVTAASQAGSQATINIGAAEGDAAAAAGSLNAPELQFGAGDGRLVFNHTETDYRFDPNLVGSGQIGLLAGSTEINNAAGFLGATTVADTATLIANGTLGGTLDVLAGGRLQGAGSVGRTIMAGTVAPGNSIGTLTVDDDYTQAAGSIYEVEVDSAGNADLIDVAGTATLNGGTVEVVLLSGFTIATPYTILSAGGGITGTFDNFVFASGSSLFLSPALTYDAGNAYLTFQQTADFDSVAETPNQIATARGLQSVGGDSAVFSAVALLDSAEEARTAFDALSGEVHASAKSALVEDSRFLREAALNRVRAAFGGVTTDAAPVLAYGPDGREVAPADTERFAAWGQAFGSWGQWDEDGNAATLDRDIGGFLLGADMAVADTWRLGLLTGYSRSSFDVDDRSSSGTSNNLHLGLYGGTQAGAVELRGGLAYTWHDIETSRNVAFGGFAEELEAEYDAGTFQAFGEAGYRIDTAAASFEPFANLAYVQLDSDGYSETGGAAALDAQSGNTETTFTTLGLRASRKFDVAGDSIAAKGMIGWRHAFGDTVPTSTHAFAAGDAFTVVGAPIAEDSAVLEFGVDYQFAGSTTLGISYEGQFASDAHDHGFSARLSARF